MTRMRATQEQREGQLVAVVVAIAVTVAVALDEVRHQYDRTTTKQER